jgi:glycosyltransferase involved in cell wall biosynthesis
MESVLDQSFTDFELLIIDNASTDGTEQVVERFQDPRIKYVKQHLHVGIAENWKTCLTYAKGCYIAFLPDDDVMEKNNLEEKVAFLMRFPNVGLVHSRYHAIDQSGCVVKENIGKYGLSNKYEDVVFPSDKALMQLIECNVIHESTTMFRRTCCEKVGSLRTDLDFAMDWEFWMRIAMVSDIGFLARPLVRWRLHAQSNTSQNLFKDGKPTINRLSNRLLALRIIDERSQSLGRSVHRHISEQLGRMIYETGSEILEGADTSQELCHEILKTCWYYPRLCVDQRILKVLMKTILSNRTLGMLRRIKMNG